MKIRALVVEQKGAPFRLQELDLADPGRGEALVRIVAAGVCHTDAITRAGDLPMPFPGVLGHEGAGIVERLGAGVDGVAVGDHVIIGWPSCGACRNCLDGQPRYCLRSGEALVSGARFKGELAGTSAYSRDGKPIHGHFFGQSSFATHSIVSADALVKVPHDVPIELLGPLPALVQLHRQGRFPFERLVAYYEMDRIEQALADSKSGKVIKPILRMPT